MPDHYVTWLHDRCEHSDDPTEHVCQPDGVVTCQAEGPGEIYCRYICRIGKDDPHPYSCEEGWSFCSQASLHLPGADALAPFIAGSVVNADGEDMHQDPGVPHCTNGHVLVVSSCNVLDWLNEGDMEETFADPTYTYHYDGPIDVTWEGDFYEWTYAKASVTQ